MRTAFMFCGGGPRTPSDRRSRRSARVRGRRRAGGSATARRRRRGAGGRPRLGGPAATSSASKRAGGKVRAIPTTRTPPTSISLSTDAIEAGVGPHRRRRRRRRPARPTARQRAAAWHRPVDSLRSSSTRSSGRRACTSCGGGGSSSGYPARWSACSRSAGRRAASAPTGLRWPLDGATWSPARAWDQQRLRLRQRLDRGRRRRRPRRSGPGRGHERTGASAWRSCSVAAAAFLAAACTGSRDVVRPGKLTVDPADTRFVRREREGRRVRSNVRAASR